MGFKPNINIINSENSITRGNSSLGKSSGLTRISDLDTQGSKRKKDMLISNIKKGEYSQIHFKAKDNGNIRDYALESSRNKSPFTTANNMNSLNKNNGETLNNNNPDKNKRTSDNFKNVVSFKYELCSPEEFSILEIVNTLII